MKRDLDSYKHELVARMPKGPIWPSHPYSESDWDALVTSLARLLGDRLTRVTLEPLDHHSMVALAQAVNPALDPRAVAAVADRSGGSPFWCELLAGARNIDTDVARLVADRLSMAGTDAAVLLVTIAVLGRHAQV